MIIMKNCINVIKVDDFVMIFKFFHLLELEKS